jgi:hypothetical protein
VRAERPGILVLACDAELARDSGRLLDHVQTVEGRDQPVVDHQVDELAVAHPVAEACSRQCVRRVRHRLHPAGHDHLVFAGPDHQIGDLHGAHARRADLVDRVGGHVDRKAGRDRCLPRRRLTDAGLEHLAHDHVLDLSGLQSAALECGADHVCAELGRLGTRQPAAETPERRPNGGHDH